MRYRTRKTSPAAFTLIELVLVLVVMATALAIAAPTLGGWRRGQRLRDAGEEFLATARHARALAIANSQIHRLCIDPNRGAYWIEMQDGQQFNRLGTTLGQEFTIPEGYKLTLTATPNEIIGGSNPATPVANGPIEFVEFYPSGRMQPMATAVITGDDGSTYVLETPSSAEGLTVPPVRTGVTP